MSIQRVADPMARASVAIPSAARRDRASVDPRLVRGRAKRLVDIALTSVLLILAAPLMLAVAILLKLSSRGPVLFRHERVGRGGMPIRVLKFRSMFPDAQKRLAENEELHALYLLNDCKIPPHLDPRITPVGKFLRRTSLDELPQLFNVLGGSMSVIGPRPIVADETGVYGNVLNAYCSVRPGITGLWQVSGRANTDYDGRVLLDRYYAERWSPWLDTKILVRTCRAVLRGDGAG